MSYNDVSNQFYCIYHLQSELWWGMKEEYYIAEDGTAAKNWEHGMKAWDGDRKGPLVFIKKGKLLDMVSCVTGYEKCKNILDLLCVPVKKCKGGHYEPNFIEAVPYSQVIIELEYK